MITLVIVSILVTVALPSYRQHVIRGKRSAAQAVMLDLANREQQVLIANRGYADKAGLQAMGYVLPSDVSENYDWDVVVDADPVPTFLVTFTPTGGQAPDGALSLDNQGTKEPIDKWKR